MQHTTTPPARARPVAALVALVALAILTAGAAACASAPAADGERAPRTDPNRLTQAEIDERGHLTAYDAVGGREALRYIRVAQVGAMQFLDSREATNRFGTNHTGGAILVTSRR